MSSLNDSGLIERIRNGDITLLRFFMQANPNCVNLQDSLGLTPLMYAVSLETDSQTIISTCLLLLNCGADIRMADLDGYSVLHWAAACADIEVLKFVLSRWTLSEATKGHDGETPLHRACRIGRVRNVQALITHFPNMKREANLCMQTPIDVAGMWAGQLNSAVRDSVRSVFSEGRQDSSTLVLYHNDCLLHVPRTGGSQGDTPWESPERIPAILSACRRLTQDPLCAVVSDFPLASDDQILRCHSREYLTFLYSMDEVARELLAPVPFTPAVQRTMARLPPERTKSCSLSDTSYSMGTLKAARRACGAACFAVESVLSGNYRNAFCIVRPPGHHVGFNGPLVSSCSGSCGFSILNTVMVAAMEIVEGQGKRVAIVDLDVHHGNGTEEIVRKLNRPDSMMFVSIHICDGKFYPATGESSDLSHNVHNVPIKPLWDTEPNGRDTWLAAVKNRVLPLIGSFRPDIILISMGFDGTSADVGNCKHELGQVSRAGIDLNPPDFSTMTNMICSIANVVCDGRVVSVLEGGYGKMQWVETQGNSDNSTRAGSDDSLSSPSSLRNGRKRLRTSKVFNQVINRQPVGASASYHLRALLGLSQF